VVLEATAPGTELISTGTDDGSACADIPLTARITVTDR